MCYNERRRGKGESKLEQKLVPDTSTTLLRDMADSQHVRWSIFRARYEPMMRAFMQARFPSLEADDIIQETFIALARALPNYRYSPQENGHFHNYLTGILRNKALKILERRARDAQMKEWAADEAGMCPAEALEREREHREWREAIYEIALQQLLADESVHERTKQIFVRLAIDGEAPQDVAAAMGVPYATVVKTKARMLARLRESIAEMKSV